MTIPSMSARVLEAGQGLAEYALIFFLIVILSIVALVFLGSHVSSQLSAVGASV